MNMIHEPAAAALPVAAMSVRRPRRGALTALVALALLGSASLLAACNTTSGVGEDLSAAGGAITKSADKNKGY